MDFARILRGFCVGFARNLIPFLFEREHEGYKRFADCTVCPPLFQSWGHKNGVYRGIHSFLIFALKHSLWVFVRTASESKNKNQRTNGPVNANLTIGLKHNEQFLPNLTLL